MHCRSFLQRASLNSGSIALAPFLRHLRLFDESAPRTQRPKRFVFVVKSSGLQAQHLSPKGMPHVTEEFVDLPLAQASLPESLRALEPYKEKLTILQGLSGRMCSIGHSSHYGALGAYKASAQAPPLFATLDGLLSREFPSVFNHVGLKMGTGGATITYPALSALDKNKQLPYQCDPQLAYMNLFGSIVEGGDIRKKYQRTGSVLDFVAKDVAKLRRSLPAPEREKLGHYLDGFETLEKRRATLISMQAKLRENAPPLDDKYTSSVSTHQLDAHFDMAAAALITGLTNVVSIHTDDLTSSYQGLGITPTVHSIGHGSSSGELSAQDCRNRIRAFHVELIAELARKLNAVPEGDGTMLDNSVIVYLSDNSNKHHSTAFEWPMVVLGALGGRLRSTGRYISYPRYGLKGHRTIGNWLTTLCHAAGLEIEHFGQVDLALDRAIDQKGPLTELLAC